MQPNRLKECDLSFSEIDELGTFIRKSHHFKSGYCEIIELTEKLGGKLIKYGDSYRPTVAPKYSLEVRGSNDFSIHLAFQVSFFRDCFTIGHELGHYFLHTGTPPGKYSIKIEPLIKNKVKYEQQANRFAAGLLMPKEEFIEVAERTNCNIMILAGRFIVPYKAVEVRLDSLRNCSETIKRYCDE